MITPSLSINELSLHFKSWDGITEVLHGISLDIMPGERVALVGESGSGKSVTARIILGTLQENKSARVEGSLYFEGKDLNAMSLKSRRAQRGTDFSMIFQDPTSALNPVYKIGIQFREVLRRRDAKISQRDADQRAAAILNEVSIPDAPRVLGSYPFQLSGGMNQRVMIAMALINQPKLLIADEPGTALDVTVQAQTLRLMRDLVVDHGTSVLLISHNLGVVREFADRIYVIYKGRIVEQGPTQSLFENPGHPYTKALLSAIPRITGDGVPHIDDQSDSYFEPMVVHARQSPAGQSKGPV